MRRWLFALTLAFASAFWAESVEGNFNPVAFSVFGWISVLPLYGLHALVLGRVAFAKAKPSFSTLYLCGVLFGLYEAYITKVVWTGWPPDPIKIGGVSLMAVLAVVLWWHPFMAFLLPLAFVERYGIGGDQGRTILSPRVSKILDGPNGPHMMVAFGVFAGLYQLSVGVQRPNAWIYGILDAAVLTFLVTRLRRQPVTTLRDSLPKGRGLKASIVGLAIVYLFCLFAFNPKSLPGFLPQLLVWGLYALVIVALLASKRRDADLATGRIEEQRWENESAVVVNASVPGDEKALEPVSLRREWLPFVVTWVLVSSFQYPIPQLRIPAFLVVTLIGIGVGIRALVVSYRRVRRPVLNGA